MMQAPARENRFREEAAPMQAGSLRSGGSLSPLLTRGLVQRFSAAGRMQAGSLRSGGSLSPLLTRGLVQHFACFRKKRAAFGSEGRIFAKQLPIFQKC
jgi:hypothetical protein